MHPSEELRGTKSGKLRGKRIVLGVSGSIAAVECVKLARELVRHGADVFPVMTPAAQKIIHPDALEFASGHKPVTQLTGAVEHVSLCGLVPDRADAYLICPATANTISKIAYGIDDTPVTTFATTAIGSKIPVIIVPAMHGSMYAHKKILENIEALKKSGIIFVQPKLEENKAKMPEMDEIVENAIRVAGAFHGKLSGKRVLIVGGASAEPIDDVRVLTNRSSGKMGVALARAAFEMGAEVEFWYGHGTAQPPKFVETKRFGTVGELAKTAERCKEFTSTSQGALNSALPKTAQEFDAIVNCAAISDYTVEKAKGKISSETIPELKLKRAPKILAILRKSCPGAALVPFKLETGISEKALLKKAKKMAAEYGASMVVANTAAAIGAEENSAAVVLKSGEVVRLSGKKEALASRIMEMVARSMK